MRIESKLCHLTENKAIVQVNGWVDEKNLGSALAEGPTVEVAEDNAISRLNKRLKIVTNGFSSKHSNNEDTTKTSIKNELSKSDLISQDNMNDEPSDWSNELTAIDSEIERLRWSRDDEIHFLETNLGINNRNKITNYNDILEYLNLLKKVTIEIKSNGLNRTISTLIDESNQILKDLSWNNQQGREYLQNEFNVSSRKELNQDQLLSFIAKLKSIRDEYQSS